MSTNSVLLTVQVPRFDPLSKGITTISAHLISTPLPYVEAMDGYKLKLSRPPSKPYQTSVEDIDEVVERKEGEDDEARGEEGSGEADSEATSTGKRVFNVKEVAPKKFKKQKLGMTNATPQDHQKQREKEDSKSTTDRESQLHHESIAQILLTSIEAVRNAWMDTEHFKTSTKEDLQLEKWCGKLPEDHEQPRVIWRSKEDEKLDAEKEEVDWIKLAASDEVKNFEDKSRKAVEVEMDGFETPVEEFFNRIVVSAYPESFYLPFGADAEEGLAFAPVLPPGSGFQVSDFSTWSSPSSGIAKEGKRMGGFDLLVIDPPWPNSSVSRANSYDTFDPYSLGKLDLPALLGTNPCLVAVWVTNKVKYRNLIIDKLFPQWNVSTTVKASEWYWVKITSNGEPVWNLDSTHRRCYEGLIVGMYNPKGLSVPKIPHEKVFLGVPIGHSRKPILLDLLRPYMPSSDNRAPNVLELFARTTLGGLEPLKRDASIEFTVASANAQVEDKEEKIEEVEHVSENAVEGEEELDAERTVGLYLAVGNEPLKFNIMSECFEFDRRGPSDLIPVRGWLV